MNWGIAVGVAIWLAVFTYLPRASWTGCKCGRAKMPWFSVRHEKEWVMGLLAGMLLLAAILSALGDYTFAVVLNGLAFILQVRALYEHRKGKRSILGRLLGRVVVTEHGRLAIGERA